MTPTMTAELIDVVDPFTRARTPMWVAHGPDGHTWQLKRFTKEAALRDGLAYFRETCELDASGRWVLSGAERYLDDQTARIGSGMATKDDEQQQPEVDTGSPKPLPPLAWEPPGGLKRSRYRAGDVAQQQQRRRRRR